ncbi:hypothetical protein DXT68_10740 [Microbacterium foliorum]|nr:hypothetical protein DXT68_10740 [Microbacterium foliorum]
MRDHRLRRPPHPPRTRSRSVDSKRVRHRIFTIPAAIARHGRRITLHLSHWSRWATIVLTAFNRLRTRPARSG